ncbi:E3 ubiquitin-protein ligase rififylin [Lates japonicus]
MWASCCNWLCMDSADVEQSGGGERRHQSYTNSAFTNQPSPTPPEHTCKACGGCFDTPAKKVTHGTDSDCYYESLSTL